MHGDRKAPKTGGGSARIDTPSGSEPPLDRAQLRLLREIVDLGPTVAFVWNMSEGWPVSYVSDSVRQFGYQPDDFYTGAVRYSDLVHPDDLDRVAREVAEYTQYGASAFWQQYRLVCRSGEVRWVSDWTRAKYDSSGAVRETGGIIIDVTAQRESNERARRYLKIAGVIFIALDSAGRVVAVNDKALEYTGESEQNILGCDWVTEFVPREQASALRRELYENFNNASVGEATVHENDIVSRTGDRRTIRWHNAVDSDLAGGARSIVKFGIDITEQKIAEQRADAMARFPKENTNPVFRIDRQGDFLVTNAATEQLIAELSEGPRDVQARWRDLVDKARQIRRRTTFELITTDQIFLFNAVPVESADYVNLYGSNITETREKEHQLADIINTLPGGLFQYVRRPGKPDLVTFANPRFIELWDLSGLDTPFDAAQLWEMIVPEDRPGVKQTVDDSARNLSVWSATFRIKSAAGAMKWVEGIGTPRRRPNGEVAWNSMLFDVTDSRYAQEVLTQTEKMQAVGQMAGGIAHDLNNILGIILGNIQLARRHDDEIGVGIHKYFEAIEKASFRATSLTRNLLGIARSDSGQLAEVVNINDVIRSAQTLVSRSITPQITIEYRLSDDLWTSFVDRGELEDAILNLSLNARDAMPDGGVLTLETVNTVTDAEFCERNPGSRPGDFVQLKVSDTGVGIPAELQKRIFEPFFTTKPKGKGTGLGLTMVSRFVKRKGGFITFCSQPGKGTAFCLYLPRFTEADLRTAKSSGSLPTTLQGGNETILVVDDESELLQVVSESLTSIGYRVVIAPNGIEGLRRLGEDESIALLFSDVIMPGGINGFQLAERALEMRPNLKILLASGYLDSSSMNNDQESMRASILTKPYSDVELSTRIRELLDQDKRRTQ